jgi:hypothetical protein
MKLKHQLLRTISIWGVLASFMALFRPDKLPIVVLIAPFVLLFMALYASWGLVVSIRNRFFIKSNDFLPKRRLGIVLCLSSVLLIVLQSLGQLTFRDVITVFAIVMLGYLYFARNRSSSTK